MASELQLKRAKAERWAEVNPVLLAGEPGYVIDENRLKIGDGVTKWEDLPYVGEKTTTDENGNIITYSPSVYSAPAVGYFPSFGKSNIVYKAENTKLLYQWNSSTSTYDMLGSIGDGDSNLIDQIQIIHGGNANGFTE